MGTTDEDIIRPELLSDEDCWLLLSRSAAISEKRELERFEKTGKGIAEKCRGLPLAAKTLGSLLRFKNTPEEWEEVLMSEMWGLEEVEEELFPHLLLSYHELTPTLKRCFSYCAFFPKDTELEVDKLIRMWMALGYLGSNMGSVKEDMELKGRIMSCKMHDIVHDFAQFVRKSPEISMSKCQVCNRNLISRVKEYRGLYWDEGTPLKEISGKIGNLVQLRLLDLSWNRELKELPESLCSLLELQILDMAGCDLYRLPEGIAQLTGLHRLSWFKGGRGRNKLGLLKNLNRLTGSLRLNIYYCSTISDLEELVEDAQQAELKNKICLQSLDLAFWNNNILRDEMEERSSSSTLWVDVIEALEPNHNLEELQISFYKGSKLLLWISSPHYRLRKIRLSFCTELSSLPPLGKLPFLESLFLNDLNELKLVGREWLGIRGREGEVMKKDDIPSSSSSATNVIVAFPKLEFLVFDPCKKLEEWEDITAGEEESAVVSIMPCLTSLDIIDCEQLKLLPHRLLDIKGSTKLIECHGNDKLVLPLGDEYP